MIKIRLARHGSKKKPFYHLVASDVRSPRDGRFLEKLGTYDPRRSQGTTFNAERIAYWLKSGAQPTHRVHVLFHKHEVIDLGKPRVFSKKPKNQED